jgi:stearoyl-CoA desaturase (delta-9 desaturase)
VTVDAPVESPPAGRAIEVPQRQRPPTYRLVLTGVVAFVPPLVTLWVLVNGIGQPIPWFDLALLVVFLVVVGHGVTVGFHRLFTHQSFVANRPLKVSLALLGTMSFQGSIIGWVADHRRHHRFSDRPGDPHSPYWIGDEPVHGWRGLWHAHVGWALRGDSTSRETFTPDLLADPDIVFIDKLFVPCCIVTMGLPFLIGYLWGGTLAAALAAFVWAGVIRIAVSHEFTWSVNSVCHRFGKRSYATRDRSTNVAVLAPITMGEAWHNNHHAFPRSARHGLDPGQFDSSAVVIRLFEKLGWATQVQWPTEEQLAARRLPIPA